MVKLGKKTKKTTNGRPTASENDADADADPIGRNGRIVSRPGVVFWRRITRRPGAVVVVVVASASIYGVQSADEGVGVDRWRRRRVE